MCLSFSEKFCHSLLEIESVRYELANYHSEVKSVPIAYFCKVTFYWNKTMFLLYILPVAAFLQQDKIEKLQQRTYGPQFLNFLLFGPL